MAPSQPVLKGRPVYGEPDHECEHETEDDRRFQADQEAEKVGDGPYMRK